MPAKGARGHTAKRETCNEPMAARRTLTGLMDRRVLIVVLAGIASSPAIGQSSGETAPSSRPNKAAFTIKTGDVRLAEGSQTLGGTDRVFDRSASSVFALEGEGILPGTEGNLSLGGEILSYNNSFKRANFSGGGFEDKMYTLGLLVKSKYYFRPGSAWQPYLGAGAGIVWAHDWGGPIRGVANGFAYQGVVGMQLRADRIGVRVEYMALRGRPTDNDGARVDVSSRGVFVGMSFFFGRR
jgi:opacity protein-like surface antigen